MSNRRQWLVDGMIGVAVGALVGAIIAVNFAIFVGIEGGYEASIADVFRENVLFGIVTVAILVAGPVFGVLMMRRRRRQVSAG